MGQLVQEDVPSMGLSGKKDEEYSNGLVKKIVVGAIECS